MLTFSSISGRKDENKGTVHLPNHKTDTVSVCATISKWMTSEKTVRICQFVLDRRHRFCNSFCVLQNTHTVRTHFACTCCSYRQSKHVHVLVKQPIKTCSHTCCSYSQSNTFTCWSKSQSKHVHIHVHIHIHTANQNTFLCYSFPQSEHVHIHVVHSAEQNTFACCSCSQSKHVHVMVK